MDGSGGSPKVRPVKPMVHDSATVANQGAHAGVVHGPPAASQAGSRAAAPQPPEATNWDGYASADPAQDYAYGEGYGYGYDAHHQGYGYTDADQGYGYAGQEYGYGADQGYGYADGSQGYGDGDQGYGYEYAHGYAEPVAHTKKPKKHRKPKPAADGAYHAGYEHQHQGDGFGQPVPGTHDGSYGSHQVDEHGQAWQDGYDYNAAPDPKPQKRDPSHKSLRVKSLDRAPHTDGAYVDPGHSGEPSSGVPAAEDPPKGRRKNREELPVATAEGALAASRAIGRVQSERDSDAGSARQEGGQGSGRSRSSDRERSGSSRAKSHRDGSGSGRSKDKAEPLAANPLNEFMRKEAKAKPADMSMVVFNDPADQTLVDVKAPPARSALNEWVKQRHPGSAVNQDVSLIVMPDDNREMLETQMFGAPLVKKQSMKLPPLPETADRPQYQPRGATPAANRPLYQRRLSNQPHDAPYAAADNPPYQRRLSNQPHDAPDVAWGKEIQPGPVPNAKCMACVHGVAVPIARILTRIACKQCQNAASGNCCTIL